ncbi:30S ribosomal protein S10 [Candidatus Peregrinibacteria bacterium CG10_big_fil_rev_8_21_14_0_10_55_24]|nr:MAG: 30S ribosomal protein S10 [Candidatus Peregrinibacteria bacterium CG10_big_fil_rev_8_21_14_0_10_55_24]
MNPPSKTTKKTSKKSAQKPSSEAGKKPLPKPKKAKPIKKQAPSSIEDPTPKTKASAAKKPEQSISSIRIRLSAFDHVVLDEAAAKIVDTAERSGAVVHGPIPLPTKIRKFTVNRSTFVHKDARDQFEMRTHRRLIDLTETTFKTIESLQNLSLPSGVDIEIKMG